MTRTLPPDPEGQNDDRAQWAKAAIWQFQICTGTDWDDAIADLLCDLMHLCDRATREDGTTAFDFADELERAREHYEAEIDAAFAATPELLEAAELVVARWSRGDLAEAVRGLDAAIAKAKAS
jgi:hypothetical protein